MKEVIHFPEDFWELQLRVKILEKQLSRLDAHYITYRAISYGIFYLVIMAAALLNIWRV